MQPGTLIAEKYRVERVIGRGGMGIVVEATHLQLETRVALKFLDEAMATDATAVARFTREARASAQLKSDHICRVSDFGIDHNVPYIVMELLVGTDLARLSKVRTLDVPTAALFISQACAGLAEAHAAQIIHRDLKPGNLFLTRRADGSPLIKVLDFGVAKAPVADDVALTGTSNVVGSPGFMSPEQFRSSRSVDARTDVWSLGVILFKLVTGKLPFNGEGFAEFALSITREPTPAVPGVPPLFAEIVAKCLEKELDRRYPDVSSLGKALAPFASLVRSSKVLALDIPPPPATAAITVPLPVEPAAVAPAAARSTLLGAAGAPSVSAQPAEPAPLPAVISRAQQTVAGTAVVPAQTPSFLIGELRPGTIVGEYKIERKIGKGGMGVVYSAIHPLIGKKAAIKVIAADLGTDPVVVQRFVQEARSVNQIGHPNIVDVFAFGQLPDGRNYFVMEMLQGENLRERLARSFIPLAEGIQILDEIVAALEAAHEQQIVHRDLKPDNVFLSNIRGSYILVKLLDFGIAKLTAGEGFAKTSTGEMMGTPAYLSPEQARGRNVDHRTDIYALGCMMYEVVTGRIPFIADSAMDVVLMHLSAPPRPPSELVPELPPALERMILGMLDKDPERRPLLADVRNMFAELVASGLVHIEAGTGATFRSELARGRLSNSEIRTPSSNPAASRASPMPVPSGLPLPAPARSISPTDAPTSIASHPGPDTITTSTSSSPKRRSRVGLAILIVVAAMLVPATFIVYGVVSSGSTADAPRDAQVTRVTHDAAIATADAATGPDATIAQLTAPDAAAVAIAPVDAAAVATTPVDAAPAARAVVIRANVPSAKIVVDGAIVTSANGEATVTLPDGAHKLEVSASGRLPVTMRLDVTDKTAAIDVKLERAKRTGTATPTGRGSGSGSGSGSAAPRGDYTLDPF